MPFDSDVTQLMSRIAFHFSMTRRWKPWFVCSLQSQSSGSTQCCSAKIAFSGKNEMGKVAAGRADFSFADSNSIMAETFPRINSAFGLQRWIFSGRIFKTANETFPRSVNPQVIQSYSSPCHPNHQNPRAPFPCKSTLKAVSLRLQGSLTLEHLKVLKASNFTQKLSTQSASPHCERLH